ncbi:hypothetical protein FRACYDRAFT_246188 [Fragilariopsis cylindrus CCMP1102]|uniref:Uncharacterized protein n=1 Tax=Fragilariopsis cylindrus CCMP1102 TaxID=635003 RepID=A0A1E7EZV5_9STRA|nr:hypothetical protein FRACYDRAFT_246188 [Fragilariopsis cylindrus CCMP1102]|eukprot:OEU11083.1 hypothetical protein FRACYDRAFT_246188 [Fragilariopsis cylindrus CCMP1102]
MALLVIQDHEQKHENHEHEHDNKQHYEGGQGLLVVGRAKSKSRTINKSRTRSSINSNSSTSTTSTSCSSSSSCSSPIRTILIPILVGCILMALGATFQSTQIIFNNNNSNNNGDDGIGIRRKTTTTSTTKDNFKFIYPPIKYERNKYTFDSFIVGGGSGSGSEGIDLAKFGFEDEDDDDEQQHNSAVTVAFSTSTSATTTTDFDYELFHDFDLSLKLTGNESWIDLLALRRDSTSRSLSFYVDKVAYKRYLLNQYSILHIDNYAAKPTHLSCSGGVWIIHNDIQNNITYVGNGKKKMVPHNTNPAPKLSKSSSSITTIIANDISQNLNKVQDKCGSTVLESYALRNVKPGVVVEERFTQPSSLSFSIDNEAEADTENDNENLLLKGGMEFKVFTIWGRAWLTVWRPGVDGVQALLYRNGTNLIYNPPMKQKKQKEKDKNKSNSNSTIPTQHHPSTTLSPPIVTKLPTWIDWERVIEIGETLGRNKDMFRTDIFVGVTASSSSSATSPATSTSTSTSTKSNSNKNKNRIRYVVSETEIHPTPLRGYEIIFNEAVIQNNEVPYGFYQ